MDFQGEKELLRATLSLCSAFSVCCLWCATGVLWVPRGCGAEAGCESGGDQGSVLRVHEGVPPRLERQPSGQCCLLLLHQRDLRGVNRLLYVAALAAT